MFCSKASLCTMSTHSSLLLTDQPTEVFDDEGRISKEISNQDSEAGVAYAKMRSVYNKKTKEMLANSSVEALMNDKKVSQARVRRHSPCPRL